MSLRYVESVDPDAEASQPQEPAEPTDPRHAPPAFSRSLRRGVRLAPVVPPTPFGREEHVAAVPSQETPDPVQAPGTHARDEEGEADVTEPSGASINVARRKGEEGLLAHFPEYSRIAFHCPVAKSVELAVDQNGRLRLVCRDNQLADARMALSWAQANEKLICAAVSRLGQDGLEVMIDLVTDAAERVADLHRTGVRLYLLTPLDVQGLTQWFRVDLNTEETAQVPD